MTMQDHATQAQGAVRTLLHAIGENPDREGLQQTPRRVVDALLEMTAGYRLDPKKILSTVFAEKYDEMVLLNGIRFFSTCEHHLLPFEGTASVGYLPNGKVVGISKLARLVQCYARRLQVQERMTEQIAHAINENLQPLGVGVVLRARHLCMACRGVQQTETDMVTSCLLGELHQRDARAEFLSLCSK